jgi:hypothetical protein
MSIPPPGDPPLPVETRTIEFSGPEVIDALVDFCRKMKRPVPTGRINPLIVVDRNQNRIAFEGGGRPARVHFYETELASALLAYCKKKRIPVARGAAKSLQFTPDSVTLRLTMP